VVAGALKGEEAWQSQLIGVKASRHRISNRPVSSRPASNRSVSRPAGIGYAGPRWSAPVGEQSSRPNRGRLHLAPLNRSFQTKACLHALDVTILGHKQWLLPDWIWRRILLINHLAAASLKTTRCWCLGNLRGKTTTAFSGPVCYSDIRQRMPNTRPEPRMHWCPCSGSHRPCVMLNVQYARRKRRKQSAQEGDRSGN
jgi:hypothetical protein